ncbi:MAG: DUF2130 domain-containing protein [SAR324 cluster bacterium]|nr:DUF2130 domain-containing protein [SAR324 cluster bacterium]
MNEPIIICPNCSTKIKLTESLSEPIVKDIRKEYKDKFASKEAYFLKKGADLKQQEKNLEVAQNNINDEVYAQLKKERITIAQEEAKKAKEVMASDLDNKSKELSHLRNVIATRDEKIAEAQQTQVEFLQKERKLTDKIREVNVRIEKEVYAKTSNIRKKIEEEAEEKRRLVLTEQEAKMLSIREKDKLESDAKWRLVVAEQKTKLSTLQNKLNDANNTLNQGSQQLQGEAAERVLEDNLQSNFPYDTIDPTARGGDVVQQVISLAGLLCGTILWESKRAKHWSDGWLAKLREDQRSKKAEISVLVSKILPKTITSFGIIDNVWVAAPEYAIPLGTALRLTLIEVAKSKKLQEGQETKMELVYNYLTGPNFRLRVEAIVEKFSALKKDLDKERKLMTKQWAKRETHIQLAIDATFGMYGDLQGIAGKALPEIEDPEMTLLENIEDIENNKNNK